MARTPFKLKSGNSTPFKQMGSSPVKHTIKTNEAGEELSPHPHKNDDGITHYSNWGDMKPPPEDFLGNLNPMCYFVIIQTFLQLLGLL